MLDNSGTGVPGTLWSLYMNKGQEDSKKI